MTTGSSTFAVEAGVVVADDGVCCCFAGKGGVVLAVEFAGEVEFFGEAAFSFDAADDDCFPVVAGCFAAIGFSTALLLPGSLLSAVSCLSFQTVENTTPPPISRNNKNTTRKRRFLSFFCGRAASRPGRNDSQE